MQHTFKKKHRKVLGALRYPSFKKWKLFQTWARLVRQRQTHPRRVPRPGPVLPCPAETCDEQLTPKRGVSKLLRSFKQCNPVSSLPRPLVRQLSVRPAALPAGTATSATQPAAATSSHRHVPSAYINGPLSAVQQVTSPARPQASLSVLPPRPSSYYSAAGVTWQHIQEYIQGCKPNHPVAQIRVGASCLQVSHLCIHCSCD